MSPVLLAVAHGSRDPAAQDCVLALTGRAATLSGGARVATAFVQNAAPSLAEGLHDAQGPLPGADAAGIGIPFQNQATGSEQVCGLGIAGSRF